MLHNGRLPGRFFAAVRADLASDGPQALTAPLKAALDALEGTTRWVQETYRSNPDDAAFGCCDYQRAFALTYLGWNWLRMVRAAEQSGDAGFAQAKRVTGEYFATRLLSQVPALLGNVRESAAPLMALDAELFAA